MTTITMEEYELMKESKYRMYVAAVDKALKSFEYTSEWADLISALGKLNKVLLGYTKFPVIPRRIKISKRLAQCMHPALPSGVHLRALETYDIIFKSMGTNRLSNELFIYSAGLFPLLGHAAMNIRPALLLVYETHFVPLEERLRPALSGFLSGILPGLEIGSDHFDRTNVLLENVCKGVGPDWFYTCVWQCVRTNSPVRLPAISYILAHYSRKVSMEDQLYLMGNDIDVMVSGLCAAVQDSSVLVQRSALDLLLVCFPMQNTQLLYADMVRLVTASLTTILRRDMSLNRRLYSWLLSSDISTTTNQTNDLPTPDIPDSATVGNTSSPFDTTTTGSPTVAFDLLTEAIRTTLKQCSAETTLDVKPYRLLTSLFEKPQIGPLILDVVLYDVFRALYHACLTQQRCKSASVARCVSFNGNLTSLKTGQLLTKEFVSKNCAELVKNANLLFNTLQSYYIWSYIAKLYEKSACDKEKWCSRVGTTDDLNINEIGSGSPNMLEICLLTDFLLDIIPLETFIENTSEILPKLFMRIIVVLKNNISNLNRYEITHSLTLCMKIVTKIQPGIMKVQQQLDPDISVEDCVLNISIQEPDTTVEVKAGLEKSKSDSRLNDKLNKNELVITNSARERSNSNQMLKKKEQKSPKIDKRAKNKKSKSSSKLDELKKEDSTSLENEDIKIEIDKTEEVTVINNCNKLDNNNNKYIKRCLDMYEQFFVVFIENKIIPDIPVETVFKKFIRDQEVLTKHLETLLEKCLESNPDKLDLNSLLHEVRGFKSSTYDVALSDYDMAMKIASNLLIEFAAFPSLLDNSSPSNQGLPYWLKVLIVCACSAKSGHEIQIIAMSTLMEIFSLAKSQIHQRKTLENSNNNIVVMGILEYKHIVYIEGSTIVLEVMSRYLWELLGALTNQSDIMLCVSLLYSLHNTFEANPIVEQVIGQYLVNENLTTEYIKRFYMLWHLGRDLNITLSNNAHIKNFDRSLLKIFDNLQHPERSNIRLLSETFLTHSLLRNDIARIINPILQKLLAPSTARISIRHVHIQDTDSTTELSSQDQQAIDDAKAKQIYAISSENGNVRYHVTSKTGQSPKPKKRWYLLSKVGKKYTQVVNMTTSLTENLNIVTKQNKDFNVDLSSNLDQHTINQSKTTVKLFINPFNSKEIYPDGADGSYTKLDPNRFITSTESISSNEESSELDSQSPDSKLIESKMPFLERIDPITNGIKDRPALLLKSRSFDEKRNKTDLENSLYHSWSSCNSESENVNANIENNDLEFSTSAEEFFQNSENVVAEILNEVLYKVCETTSNLMDEDLCDGDLQIPRDSETNLPKLSDRHVKNFTLFPMHCHLCLYYEVFDSYQILYSLKTLKSCLISNPHLFIRCLATTGLKDMKSNELLNLLARHRKSLLGNGFSGEINQDYQNFYRGYMFLDIILLVCLNYARSFYPMIDDVKLTKEELSNNQQIQLDSLEILDIIIKYLVGIVNDNAKGFGKYIADMLVKCKLQKVLLHCLLTSVRKIEDEVTFAEEVLLFNGFRLYDHHKRVSEYVEAYQIQLLRLIHSVVILEYHVFPASEPEELLTEHLYTPTIPIPKQEMFLSAVVSALRHQNMKHLHQNWCNMVTSCLPYFQDNLKHICLRVIFHICNNVERIAETYKHELVSGELCPDYATTQLESLSVLVHYCLLDATQTANPNLPFVGNGGSSSTSATAVAIGGGGSLTNNGEIFSNLVNAFFSPIGGEISLGGRQNTENYQLARKMVLSHMPRIISSVAKLWQTIVGIDGEFHSIFGNCKMVKQQLLEFLSPIAVHHGSSFLAAVAVAWNDRRNPFSAVKTILPEPNESQNNMVYLISAIRVIPLDNLVQTVIAVIKNPPPTEGLSADVCLDVSVLELFYCYMRNASETQLCEAWSSLMTLVKEGCSLAPTAQFLLVALLHELMIKCCPMDDRKDQKDLQDVTAKLIESVSQVCGSCLEQTTWLRRNLAVKEQDNDSLSRFSSISTTGSETLTSVNSVQAQLVLSEILAPILDICFGSSEKDKVNTILTSLMYNIVPYLKTHTNKNMASFSACSKLLSSLSSYQYTRKAWRKDVFDLLLDNSLFQMDHSCLKYWKIIIDNLMTHDNTTFKDLMARVSLTQSGGLSIFSSREQEYEQRAQLLKRLAFVIFCSEIDQYAKYMPEIQEQLTTSLRISVPGIQAQVFLCFRVLLLRMSPIQMTSLWPIIISEMLQVFIQVEQELTTDSEEFRNNTSAHIKLLSGLDASWATNSNNGLHALGHPHWLRLQLAACKLLDLALLLPATSLPQFQMYRWAFVGDDLTYNNAHRKRTSNPTASFLPHVTRIANLMDQKFADTELEIMSIRHNELLLTMNNITQLKELRGFFKTLSLCSNRHRTECNGSVNNDYVVMDRYVTDKRVAAVLDKLDRVMEMDFLDKIPR